MRELDLVLELFRDFVQRGEVCALEAELLVVLVAVFQRQRFQLSGGQVRSGRKVQLQDFVEAFKSCDVIMGPTSPCAAFGLGEKSADPVQMYLSDIYTIAVNLAGLPGMSLPCGFSGGLPVGLQLIGDYFSEAQLLNVAHRYQQASSWHLKVAPE